MGTEELPPTTADFLVKTTADLTSADRRGLSNLFSEVFGKPFPETLFESKYMCSALGYSLHCLMMSNGSIVGAYSAVPIRYSFFGQHRTFAIAIDLMVATPFRGRLQHVRRMSDMLCEQLAARGLSFMFSCVREEMWLFHQVVSKWKFVGGLTYYFAPVRVFHGRRLATALRSGISIWNRLGSRELAAAAPQRPIHKLNDDDFRRYRYGMFPIRYQQVQLTEGLVVYTTELFYPIPALSKLAVALIVDVDPPTPESLASAVDLIADRESTVEFVAYLGSLPFPPRNMLPVSKRLDKQHWVLAGRILRTDLVDDRIFDISNWSINLSNGDLV